MHPPGDRPRWPPFALPRLSCPSLDVCSTRLNQTLLLPCCWPRPSTKRCILGLGVSVQSAMSCPDGDSLGVGCCKAVDGWKVRKPAYNELSMVIPLPSHQTGSSAHPLSMAQTELNGAYCCNVFKLAHLFSKHRKYGGEQLKIASSMFLKKCSHVLCWLQPLL